VIQEVQLNLEVFTWAAMSGSSKCSLQTTKVRLKISKSGWFALHNFSIICHAAPFKNKIQTYLSIIALGFTVTETHLHHKHKVCVTLHDIRCGYTGHFLTWEIAFLPHETAFSSVTDISRGKLPVLNIHGYVKKITRSAHDI